MNFEQAEKSLRQGKSISRRSWGGKVDRIKIDKRRKSGFRTEFKNDVDIFEFTQVVFSDDYFNYLSTLPETEEPTALQPHIKGKFPRWNITLEDTQANDYYLV